MADGTKVIGGKRYRIWTTVNNKKMAMAIATRLRKNKGYSGTGQVPRSVRVLKFREVWSVYYR